MRHRDDTILICQLVCVIVSWAHTSFVHSILSLKLGVTNTHLAESSVEAHVFVEVQVWGDTDKLNSFPYSPSHLSLSKSTS